MKASFSQKFAIVFVFAALVFGSQTISLLAQSRRQPPTSDQKKNKRPPQGQETGEKEQEPLPTDIAGKDSETIKVSTSLVNVDTVVYNKKTGKITTGLKKENFELFVDGVKKDITNFSTPDAPITITLVVEYLNRFECYFLTTAVDAKALVQSVNHPNFKTMYDTFHANIEEKNPGTAIAALGSDMVHVHISECDRGTPGTGMVHWDETFAALKKANYNGWLTIEAFGRALPDLAAATKVWRDLFPSPEDVYTNGLKFIKQKWGA